MARIPYMSFPFPFNRGYSKAPYPSSHISCNSSPINHFTSNYYNTSNQLNSHPQPAVKPNENENCRNLEQKNKSNKNDDYLFDLFGLKIYSDDVLLISLIYFLYSEGVKDDGLFIVLILLLLS